MSLIGMRALASLVHPHLLLMLRLVNIYLDWDEGLGVLGSPTPLSHVFVLLILLFLVSLFYFIC